MLGSRLDAKATSEQVAFNVKAKLEEKERKSQLVTIGFGLLVTSKPSLVKFEIEGTAALTGKDEDIRKMLEMDPEARVPYVLPRIYQHAFTAMYLLSTVLNTPPPPQGLLGSQRQQAPAGETSVEVETPPINASTAQEAAKEEKPEMPAPTR